MCGIAGIIDFSGSQDYREVLKDMLTTISYRGPDESGMYLSRLAAMGNVRLSIIDIEGGQQPLSDPTGRFWIVFNGEIFNFTELRAGMEKQGHKFQTHSDTEVLVQLYAVYGKRCLNMLNGQFAFAIWDKLKEELFIARDRVGIRPLFYNLRSGIFSFASEIKSLFCQNKISPEFDYQKLHQAFTFWTTISPDTVFKGIYELTPGHCLTFNRDGVRIERFWQLQFSMDSSLSVTDAIDRFNELFTDAVRIRLRADVEVAAYLSGGIDSTATVSYIKKIEPGILNTFSIGFEETIFDETPFQNEAVKYLDTSHKSIKCNSKDIADSFPEVVWHSEIPLTRTAPAPMMILSKLVRENNIKVVITGEGSDEILAGYNIFKETLIRRFWAAQPDSKIRPLLLSRLYPYLPLMKQANPNALKLFFGYKLDEISNPLYSHLLRWNNSNHIKKHLTENLKNSSSTDSVFTNLIGKLPASFENWEPLAKSQWLETTIFMSGYLLSSQGDRMAMANSVEGRYPFLDYRLIEFCSTLPSSFKLRGLNEKYLLKRMLQGRIPDSILKRSKQAYRAPIKSVFLSENSPEYVGDMLSKEQTLKAGVFDFNSFDPVISRIKKSDNVSEMDNMLLTAIISTHLLHHQFVERNLYQKKHNRLNKLKIVEDK